MNRPSEGLVQSVQTRLVRHAQDIGVGPNRVLTRCAIERVLYRLSMSPCCEPFVLKRALLLLVGLGETIRPTRDAHLLGFGDLSHEALRAVLGAVCTAPVEPDGMQYLPDELRIAAIRPEDAYGGKRVTLPARLGPARLRVQLDTGISDAVTPAAERLEYPSLLGFPAPRLRAHLPETAIAGKLHAMVLPGARNSRVRDCFDICAVSLHERFGGHQLRTAIAATFARRGNPLPEGTPSRLAPGSAALPEHSAQWRAFRTRSRLTTAPADFGAVVGAVRDFLVPPLSLHPGQHGHGCSVACRRSLVRRVTDSSQPPYSEA